MKLLGTDEAKGVVAAKAGMSEKTARKWAKRGKAPSETRVAREYLTRPDAFAGDWAEIEKFLRGDPSLEAKTIFDYLCRRDPERYQEQQLRTLQRKVKRWRGQKGAPREVYFPQEHVPGRQAQSDFTHMNRLGVTILGQRFDHMLYHLTLTYSNWEWGEICFTESYESLAGGVQNALWELGGVPVEHRTDSLSAAVRPPERSKEEFTEKYQGLLRHFGMKASHSSPGRGHENGDIEQSHHRFKRAVDQELMLRGKRDFATRGDYAEFLAALFTRRNRLRGARVAEERKVLGRLPGRRLEACTKERVRVSPNATVHVRGNYYSVPSQLIQERVEVRIYSGHLEVWYGGAMAERMERLRGRGGSAINYRHVIHSLVKKPGAFAHYKFQAGLFPRAIFRMAYDELLRQQPGRAEGEYLKLLELAAGVSEATVAEVLRETIESGAPLTSAKVREEVQARADQPARNVLAVRIEPVALGRYDQFINAQLSRGEVAL
jgi:transposase